MGLADAAEGEVASVGVGSSLSSGTGAGEVVGGAKLVVFHWDATNVAFLRKTIFHPAGLGTGIFEHVCFAPISLQALSP